MLNKSTLVTKVKNRPVGRFLFWLGVLQLTRLGLCLQNQYCRYISDFNDPRTSSLADKILAVFIVDTFGEARKGSPLTTQSTNKR